MSDIKPLELSVGTGIKISGLKCFGATPCGMDEIRHINVIIGRNNSGKSALLDMIESMTRDKPEFARSFWHKGTEPALWFTSTVDQKTVERGFDENTSGGHIGDNHRAFGLRLIGDVLHWKMTNAGAKEAIQLVTANPSSRYERLDQLGKLAVLRKLIGAVSVPFRGSKFRRLLAKRDIRPESSSQQIRIEPNGDGCTNLIQRFINSADLDSGAVELELLTALNKIFRPDSHFTRILTQQLTGDRWEIFLEENEKGRIALSSSGSGLKTVILVLCYMILVPRLENAPLAKFVFAFEELENNLHPSLLRRLLAYVRDISHEHGIPVFVTTHASSVIDLFSRDANAQILHVSHMGTDSSVSAVRAYCEGTGVLNDLDVRASDLLQSNYVIWVEGPTERLYLARWIELWSDGELEEGVHYQTVFYGGRLLSHLSASEPGGPDRRVEILRLARNASVVMDSDRRTYTEDINDTKRRLREEITGVGGFAWVTDGREIENYIPAKAVERWLNLQASDYCGQFDSFFDYLDGLSDGLGKRMLSQKYALAEAICPFLERDDCAVILDLDEQVRALCERIRLANGLTA